MSICIIMLQHVGASTFREALYRRVVKLISYGYDAYGLLEVAFGLRSSGASSNAPAEQKPMKSSLRLSAYFLNSSVKFMNLPSIRRKEAGF